MKQSSPQKMSVQSKIPKKQSRSEEPAIQCLRGVQGLFSRRKKVRNRQRECGRLMRSSIDINLSVNEEQKAAEKELIQESKASKRASLKKGKKKRSVTELCLGFSRFLRGKKRANERDNEARDGDGSSSKTRKVELGLLFLGLNQKQGIIRKPIGGKLLIGCLQSASVLRWRKSDLRRKRGRRMARREVYGSCRNHEWAKRSAAMVKETNFSLWQVFPSSCAYLNSIVDAFNSHNHPFSLLLQNTISVYVCVYIPVNSLVGFRIYLQFPVSSFVIHMEKNLGKLAWDSETHVSNNMSISSSTNQSGINTQGLLNKGKDKLDENLFSAELTSMEDRIRTPHVESLDAQLEKIRLESLEFKKNNSLMGFVCGNSNEFKKVKAKLLSIWRLMKGEVQIYERGHGWFECIFRDPLFLNKVWNGRPYHVLGHLLLLRPWRVDFSTKIENTNVLDLWIRIFHLPSTLACHNGVKLILEENGLGSFIKFDRASGGFFARACVNIDVDKHVPGDVRISDNEDHPLLLVWSEDFPHGCGNCGAIDHVYKMCPLRKFIPKKISITIVRKDSIPSIVSPSTEIISSEENEEGWVMVNNNKKKKGTAVGSHLSAQVTAGTSSVKIVDGEGMSKAIVVVNSEKEGTNEVYSSPPNYFKDGEKEEGEIFQEMEAFMEKEVAAEGQVEEQSQEQFMKELERDLIGSSPLEMALNMKEATPSMELDDNNTSTSDSNKRKGEKETKEDTACSSLKRKKSRGVP